MTGGGRRPRRRLPAPTIATRLLGWFLAMALLPLAMVLFVSSRGDASKLRAAGLELVRTTAERKAKRIETFVSSWRDAALALARTPAAAEGARRLEAIEASGGVDSAEYAVVEANLRPFFSRYLRDFGFADLFLISATGEGTFAVNETDGLGFNYDTGPFKGADRAAAFRQVRDSGAFGMFGFESFSVNQRAAYLGVPIISAGATVGIAIFEVDKEAIFAVVGDHAGLGDSGETLLGAGRGDSVVIVAPTRFEGELPPGRLLPGAEGSTAGLLASTEGGSGTRRTTDHKGTTVLASWRPLKTLGLGLEVQIDEAEVLGPVREQRRTLLQLAAVGIPLLVLGALVASRSVSRPIVRLTDVIRRIAAGDSALRVAVAGADEVGQLSRAFNAMTAELAASYASVEETVRARTAELELLQRITAAANGAAGQEEATRRALELVCSHTAWPVGHFLVMDDAESSGALMSSGIWHLDDEARMVSFQEASAILVFPPGIGLPGRALQDRSPVWTVDLSADSAMPRAEAAQQVGLKASMAFPVLVGPEVAGVLEFFSPETEVPDEAEIRLLSDVGIQIGRVIERARSDRALHEAKEAAEVANQTKSTFLASMSHELRTPLNAIIGYSEMLEEEATDAGEEGLLGDLGKIRSAGRHLLGIINDVLDLSKIEAGKIELFLETFPVATLIDDVAVTVRPLAEANGNRFEVELAEDIGVMHADLSKLRQSLVNLAGNASKFTEGGTVTLRVLRDEACDPATIIFEVTDTGIGIAPEAVDRLFQAFSQAESSTTRRFGGTGLGLVISRRFCRMMGGDIELESVVGEGSTFRVRIPAMVQATPDDMPRAVRSGGGSPALADGTPMRPVMVIEHDPRVRSLLEALLTEQGHRVVLAEEGDDHLDVARRLRPAAITVDLAHPTLPGWNILTAMKADPELSGIPVIAMLVVDDAPAPVLSVTDYLTKPVQRDQLAALLGAHRPHPDAPILVVEDDAASRDLLRRLLERQGFAVVEAADGQEGLQRVAERSPSLVLLDLQMPVMDGFEFLAALSANPEWQAIPVVVVTARDLTADEQAWLSGRAAEVLRKGAYTRDLLLDEVRKRIAGGDRTRET